MEKVKTKRIRPYIKTDKRKDIILTPQRKLFINLYTNPKSETFGNAYKSAITAGFKQGYANQILSKNHKWLREIDNVLNDERMLLKAEENFREVQELKIASYDSKLDKVVVQTDVLAHRNKVDMFLAERLNKAKYSTRTENAVLVKHEHTIDDETKAKLDKLLG